MKTEQEFLCEVIKRGNQKKAKRRTYISVLTVCLCIAMTAVAIPIINNHNSTLPPEQDTQVQTYTMDNWKCIQFFINADIMCGVKDELKSEVINDNSTSNSTADNSDVSIDENASGYPAYPFQTQNMTGAYTVTDNGFKVVITNADGDQKRYTLVGNILTATNGEVCELTDRQIHFLNYILKESLD